MPYNLLGKTLTFTWKVNRDGSGRTKEEVKNLEPKTIKMPEASAKLKPVLSMPMLTATSPGKLEVPWFLASDSIVSAYYEYDDARGVHHKENLNNIGSGIITLNANEPHRNFRLVCSYKEAGSKGSYLIEGASTATQNMPLIHAPVGLVARPLNDRKAKVELTWNVPYLNDEDLTPTDFFEVQRSLTGKEEDFVTIGQEYFAKNKKISTFTFVDSTLIESVTANMLKGGGTLEHLTYRVRRVITQEWGWNHNCAASATCVVDRLHLLRIADYSAKWEDERAYSVRVSWNYEDEHGAVWDDRAKMMLRVVSRNREGATVDSLVYVLEDNDRAQRYKIVNLTRSCVYYNIDMYVERNESPINFLDQTEEYFFPIRNAADWHEFLMKVENAKNGYDVSARLYADITTSEYVGGGQAAAFNGIFDGNGHTLTFNKSDYTLDILAPFRVVGNATIKNLHVAGSISTSERYAAGIVGYIVENAKVVIENCRSSVTINCSRNGSNLSGGLVGRVSSANVTIRNSKFDGSFEGANSYGNGGFTGWVARDSKVIIENCLFAPDRITTKMDNCETWARLDTENVTCSITNSYATKNYTAVFISIRNHDDWMNFRTMVENAKGQYWVDACLEADIETVYGAGGGKAAPYRGTFDGNGHTINANIGRSDGAACALFSYVGDVTIKNLHLTGKSNGGRHTAGLIGYAIDGTSTITLDRVWVSTEVSTTTEYCGGIIGHANSADVVMTDCRFDGTLENNGANEDSYAGSIIGWCNGGRWTLHRIYDQSNFKKAYYKLFCIDHNSSTGKWEAWWGNSRSTYLVTHHGWTSMNYYDKTDQNEVMNLMNGALANSWAIVNGKAAPVLKSTSSEDSFIDQLLQTGGWVKESNTINPKTTSEPNKDYRTIPDPNLKGLFYHKNTGTIDPTLLTTTRQSSVLLAWNTDGKPIDYFKVMRRVQGEGDDKWIEVATDLTDLSYEDTSVSPLATYEYKVLAVNDCEGITYTETEVKVGECKHTGRVAGYVRFNDGTGVPDVRVDANYDGKTVKYAMTDESGYFVIDELSYHQKESVNYEVKAVGEDGITFENDVDSYEVTFGASSNDETVHEFIITSGKRFSGYVMYDGTSIPVKGVNFMVNGRKIHNAKGDFVETDYDGSFSFRVMQGDNTIQAVMDNHTFTNDGFYKNSNAQNISSDVAGIYFYDATKVKQVYCKGYPTLFQEGQVSEVIDLTDCLISQDTTYVGSYSDVDSQTVSDVSATYNAVYNRIYHSPVEVTYRQIGYDTFDYFGDKEYTASELTGETTQVTLAYANPEDTTQAIYSFKHPVFSIERKYNIQLQVAEYYRYNNDPTSKPDMVPLGGGTAYMQNGMNDGALLKEPVQLDSLGRATFTLKANMTTTLLTDESALKTVTFSAEHDGNIYVAEPLQGALDMFMYNANGSKAFSYTMVVGNNISTSGDPSMVGADADLYIGSVQNVVVTPMSTIRAVTKKMYNEMIARQGQGALVSEVGKYDTYGTVVKISEGEVVSIDKDKKVTRDTIYLVRDVALGYGPKIQSQFVYSQKQLLTQIIPAKAKEIVDLMYIGTKDDAQAIANSTKQPVYLSLREPTDSLFAVVNRKIEGHSYNTTIDKAEKGINYLVVLPSDKKESDFSDEVADKYWVLKAWADMISRNEGEKLGAHDLLTNYDIAGAQGVNYSETFDTNYSNTFTHYFPIATEVDYWGAGAGVSHAASAISLAGTLVTAIALSLQEMKAWSVPTADIKVEAGQNGNKSEVTFGGSLFQWSLFPVLSYTTIGTNAETKSYNRTETFTIACDPYSHLNVDVYRVQPVSASGEKVSPADIFSNYNSNKLYDEVYKYTGKEVKLADIVGPRGFVFRTRGGSTQNPWEDKRVTKIYRPGTELDARTLKIVNPKIRLDKQSVSGVSINDAAKFTVFVSNESEKPEALEIPDELQLFVADQSNPMGAKITVNGQPLTTAGMTVTYAPGAETALTMEVRAGQGFDFENLVIGVMSPADPNNTTVMTSFDVHFLREAGGLAIAAPGDKWVLNTNAQKDSERGWYLPVTINGFDRHQHNFDHIEFQYKESQRGDDSWTNLCSFYANDSLMANANGVRKLIPENGNIVTEFYGEGWVMEREYDLRAVLFCRNGSDFLTTSSQVIHGIKDTRRPQLFGTPEPKSGLLTQGDDIVFNFSEDIEYNYLSAITNFEVKGEVNNNNLSEMVSVQFAGQASVESEAKRNFSGKDLTIDMMIKPAETGRDMPLFSHGTNGQKLQLWLTSDFKLKAVVNDQTFTSTDAISKNAFRQVAVSINQQDSTVTFFKGGVEIGRNKLTSLYYGTGPLIFGRTNEVDRAQSEYYEGRMMEARLWYAAMDGGLIGSTYGSRRLTGYESNLVDYYPMNEGSGDYVTDHTQGANAKLMGASWAIPRGWSLNLKKEDKGVELTRDTMNRTSEQDYTLMFWFKTDADGRGALLSNGRGLKEDNGAESLFHIGFEGDKLMYRSNGFATEVPGDWSDGQWHNFAMTVNRARNVDNIYVDKELRTTFEADSLGGISGGYPLIGATRYNEVKENGDYEVKDGDDALTGNVDELLFFAQALPQKLIETYAMKSPNGDEAGLLTYLSFDRIERQKDNDLELVAYAYSKKIYLDDKGQPRYQLDPLTKEPTDTLVRDYLFVDEEDVVKLHFDQTQAAPVMPYEEVKNLKFGFIGRGNQLLVELDENAARLNHRNIYVTVRDIEDKNGNTMASPQTACYYVTNSSLQWILNRLDATIKYGSGEGTELPFYNNGASNHSYTIENCPKWLTLDKYSGTIAPQALDYVYATASKDLNIGTYNEIIYLTDEEGITEPFYLNLTVEGEQPDWAANINGDLLRNSMNISGQVYLYDELDTDSRDIVGVFDNQNVCHGFANISNDVQSGDIGLYLTVYDNQSSGRELNFRLWQYSTGREIVLTPDEPITFVKDAMLGTDKPVRFDGGEAFVQNFKLQEGWNWVSFNLNSPQLSDVNKLLSSMPWSDNDVLTDMTSDTLLIYKGGQWLGTGSTANMAISPKKAYAIKVKEACTFPIGGTIVKEQADRTIELNQGWNAIGYTPISNLTVETALSDYYDQAETGDVIKSHTEFAYFTKSGNVGRWRGNLQYMKPGEGYMLLRKSDKEASFTYPFYDPNSNYREDWSASTSRSAVPMARNTMSVSASVEGFELQEGDRLVAYADGEVCGEAVSGKTADNSEPLYLTIGGEKQANVWFAIERDGDIVASTRNVVTFHANDVLGSPDEPFAINFSGATGIDLVGGYEPGKWYTVSGVQLPNRPKKKGVYIFNGNKVVIK